MKFFQKRIGKKNIIEDCNDYSIKMFIHKKKINGISFALLTYPTALAEEGIVDMWWWWLPDVVFVVKWTAAAAATADDKCDDEPAWADWNTAAPIAAAAAAAAIDAALLFGFVLLQATEALLTGELAAEPLPVHLCGRRL